MMTQRDWAPTRRTSGWFALLAAALGLIVSAIVAACEIPSHANDFAIVLPDATTTECSSGQTLCAVDGGAPVCTDTQVDTRNCGSCGNACSESFECSFGTCSCPSGQTSCGGSCTDLSQDDLNCGACDAGCGTDRVCITSDLTANKPTCVLFCAEGKTNCTTSCADLQTSPTNCGSCGATCSGEGSCQGGACESGCNAPGYALCDGGVCDNTTNDDGNCGACGNVCPSNSACKDSTCQCRTRGEVVCPGPGKPGAKICVKQSAVACGPDCYNCLDGGSGGGVCDPGHAALPGLGLPDSGATLPTCIYDAGGGN